MDHPRPGLRYVDADDLDDSALDFDGLDVESTAGEKLGDVDGFVIDINAARPMYVVVDAGGWFWSKYFLLPVGHVALDSAGRKLVADVPRERVARFPGFDRDEFEQLTDGELMDMDEQMLAACCPDQTFDRLTAAERYNRWSHYRQPGWWDASYYRPDRVDNAARALGAAGAVAAGSSTASSTTLPSRDEVRANRDREREREATVASEGDVSPHFGGRAQPGDVLGIETGGEETHVGDTTEDENKRREEAEKKGRHRT